jgi:hypothetical protein
MQKHIDSGFRNKRKMHKTTPEKLSEFQCKVVDIMGIVGGGIYNAPINPDKIDWDCGRGVSVVWQRELATWDFNALTILVLLCHEARIRCSVEGAGPRQVRLSFWQRKHEGGMAERHPNIDEAVALFREYLPADSQIHYVATEALNETSK